MTDYSGQTSIFITPQGDAEIDSNGLLVEDTTIQSRVNVRLMANRGKYYRDKDFGSMLYTRKNLHDAETHFGSDCEQALKPLLDSGEIIRIEVGGIETDPGGQFRGQLLVYVTEDEVIKISGLPIGPNKRNI